MLRNPLQKLSAASIGILLLSVPTLHSKVIQKDRGESKEKVAQATPQTIPNPKPHQRLSRNQNKYDATSQNKQEPKDSTFKTLMKLYVIIAYIIVGYFFCKYIHDANQYFKKGEAIGNTLRQPSIRNVVKVWNTFCNAPLDLKIRTQEEMIEGITLIAGGFVIAPITLPYFLFEGFPTF